MNDRQIKRLEARLAKKLKDPWKHKLVVLGQSRRSRMRWALMGPVTKVQCWYWRHLGRLQGWLDR